MFQIRDKHISFWRPNQFSEDSRVQCMNLRGFLHCQRAPVCLGLNFLPVRFRALSLGSSIKKKQNKTKQTGCTKVHLIFWVSPNQLSAPVLEEEGLGSSWRVLEARAIKESELGVQSPASRLGRMESGGWSSRKEMKHTSRRKTQQNMHDDVSNSHPWIHEGFPRIIKAFFTAVRIHKTANRVADIDFTSPQPSLLFQTNWMTPDFQPVSRFLPPCWSITCRWDVK